MSIKTEIIVTWLKRIQNSELSVSQFFFQYTVPFSRSQYFVYKKKFAIVVASVNPEGAGSTAFCIITDGIDSPFSMYNFLAIYLK